MSTMGNSFLTKAAKALACLCLFVLPALASDTTPPTLISFTFAPNSVDTTTNSAPVTATAQLSDDLSGVVECLVFFTSPSGKHSAGTRLSLISGTNLNGTWQGQIIIPAYSEPGTWVVSEVESADNLGNGWLYTTSQVQALGFPTALQVTSQQDITPPTLISFTFTPTSVNTTSTSANVNVTAQISDDLSGVVECLVFFTSPSGKHSAGTRLSLISGTNLNGTWQGQIIIPAYSEPGTWMVSEIESSDNVGNGWFYTTNQIQALGFPTALQVTSQQDVTPPTLNGFTFTPASVNTTSTSASVTATAQISDDLSGVVECLVFFTSPSGKQSAGARLNLVSGTNINGTWQGQIFIPAYSEPGTWTVSEVSSSDNVGNGWLYSTAQLQALGFPTNLQVDSGSSVALTSSLNPSTYAQPVTFTATVTSGSGNIPTGTVNFTDGSTTFGSATLDSNGLATFTASTLAAGTHSIVAAYLGDANNPPANSPALSQVVTQVPTTTALTSSLNPSVFGDLVTFRATVASSTGGAVTGGIVTFSDGPTLLCRHNVIHGHAACRTSSLTLGTHHIVARYLGGIDVQSSKASINQIVQ